MKEKKTPPPDKRNAKVHTTELLKRRWLSKKAFEIKLTRPALFEFIPGQCLCFIHEAMHRYYAIISSPTEPTLSLCIHYVENGAFSPLLATAEMGTRFSFTGPHGYFTFRPSQRPPVFIASGTGIAPFLSIGHSGVTGFTLLHEAEKPAELYYESFFRSSAKLFVPCLPGGKPDSQATANAFSGKAAEYLTKRLRPSDYDFYLCGEREMIREVTLLVDERFPESLVYREVFY